MNEIFHLIQQFYLVKNDVFAKSNDNKKITICKSEFIKYQDQNNILVLISLFKAFFFCQATDSLFKKSNIPWSKDQMMLSLGGNIGGKKTFFSFSDFGVIISIFRF